MQNQQTCEQRCFHFAGIFPVPQDTPSAPTWSSYPKAPYSNLPAEQTPYGCDEWLDISRAIRLHHECSHVVCRRVMPEEVLPVFDEITADMVGLICATGRYDAGLASRFLGVTAEGFSGGRLSEYLHDEQLKMVSGGWGASNPEYRCPSCGEPLIFAIDKRWFCKTCFKFYDL